MNPFDGLYCLIYAENVAPSADPPHIRRHRLCPDLFVSEDEALKHYQAEHADLPAVSAYAVRSDLLRTLFPEDRLDAPHAIRKGVHP